MHESVSGNQRKELRRMKRRRSVITGIGPITCIGMGVENFWKGILAEKSGITRISSFDTSMFNAHCGGEISNWSPGEFFPPHRLKRLDRYAQFSVASAKLALDDAGLTYSQKQPQHRIGVSFGTALGGVCQAEDQHIRFLKRNAWSKSNPGPSGLRRLRSLQHRD